MARGASTSAARENRLLIEVMNISPDDLDDFHDRPPYDKIIKQYRNSSYRWLHLARRPSNQRSTSYELCMRCQAIDLEGIFNTHHVSETGNGIPVFDLGNISRSTTEGCSLCRILISKYKTVRKLYPDRHATMWRLEVFPAIWQSDTHDDRFDDHDRRPCNILGAFPSDFGTQSIAPIKDRWIIPIRPLQSNTKRSLTFYQCRAVDHRAIDYGFLRTRLEECLNDHPCSIEGAQPIMAPELTVIDCQTRKIIPLSSSTNYICLSYVWGTEHLPSIEESSIVRQTGRLPVSVPKTIEDAIRVVLNLHERYLWVDRYCIDQYHSRTKKAQIAAMADVFGNALFTIVALGQSSTSGLPGVSDAIRRRQDRFSSNRNWYLYTSTTLKAYLQQSRWSSRGWTFQEASLSKRILFFTPSQVVLVCGLGEAAEEMDVSVPRQLRLSRTAPIECNLSQQMLSPSPEIPVMDWNADPMLFVSQTENYRSRYLTYESDTLNAFRGLLASSPYESFWGVPIYHRQPSDSNFHTQCLSASDSVSTGFVFGLLWHTNTNVAKEFSRAKRKAMFPSWSWASVRHPICLYYPAPSNSLAGTISNLLRGWNYPSTYALWYHAPGVTYSARVSISSLSGHLTSLRQVSARQTAKVLPEDSPVLHIDSHLFHWPQPTFEDDTETRQKFPSSLSYRLRDPGTLLQTKVHPFVGFDVNVGHSIIFDAECMEEYVSICSGQQRLSAILLLGRGWNYDGSGTFRHSPVPYTKTYNLEFNWLAVVFNKGTAKRVGIIESFIQPEYELDFGKLEKGVFKVV